MNRIFTSSFSKLLVGVFTLNGMWNVVQISEAQVAPPNPTQVAPRQLDAEERSNVELFRLAAPSVVNICTKTAVARRTGEVTLSLEAIPTGAGSGFLWDSQGHVVTNYHVVREADAAQVTLGDGSVWDAELVGTAPEFDNVCNSTERPVHFANNRPRLTLIHGGDKNVGVNQKGRREHRIKRSYHAYGKPNCRQPGRSGVRRTSARTYSPERIAGA